MTLYLKYRPQLIEELDLEDVRKILEKTLKSDHLPHALLFTGPRGTGKTSAARIVAKVVNCQKKKSEPCNECEMCKEITNGSATDVIEIDAASNRGIEEIRDLRDKVKLAPMRARVKVYIIDEVHMLTTEAANALLKTLEEPPDKVMFILCTTEAEKLPETVVSRCTVVKFGKPSLEELVGKLKVVAKKEELKIEIADLKMIAVAAKGSFRDAIKIVEQVLATGMKVDEVLGLSADLDPAEFLKLVQDQKTDKALTLANQLVEQGVNVRGFIERCVEQMREQLLAEVGRSGKSDSKIREMLNLIGGLEKAYEQTKTTAVTQLPLEIFVIENTQARITNPNPVSGPEFHTQQVKEIKKEETPKEVIMNTGGKFKLDDVTARWSEIMAAVRPKNHSVEALLRSTKPVGFDGEKLQLEVFYQFHKDKLESEKCRQIVEGAVAEVFQSGKVRLYLRLGDKKKDKDDNLGGKVDEEIIAAAKEIFKVDAI